MKVILVAFQGKLKSEVMDIPESPGGRFKMALDLDLLLPRNGDVLECAKVGERKIGTFQQTGKTSVLPNGALAWEYVLVDI